MAKLAIKSDNRKQNLLLPPSLDELVPENHMVVVSGFRIINIICIKRAIFLLIYSIIFAMNV